MLGQEALARRGLALYAALVIVASAAIDTAIFRDPKQGLWFLALMWCPGLSAVACRLLLREGFADVSFRWGGRQGSGAVALAYGAPLAIGALAYGVAWTSGLANFTGTPAAFAGRLALAASVGIVETSIGAFGEELGWRGYMLTRLVEARVPMPLIASGVIWGLWHLPLILGGAYAPAGTSALGLGCFFVTVISGSVLAGVLRLRSGSIWPAVIFHAAWNCFMQILFDAFTAAPAPWVGEGGILVAVITAATAASVYRIGGGGGGLGCREAFSSAAAPAIAIRVAVDQS